MMGAAAVHGTLSDRDAGAAGATHAARSPVNALVGFASRWLELNKLAGVVPDTELYPEFDGTARDGTETRLFVGSQMHDDRSVVALLTANYSS